MQMQVIVSASFSFLYGDSFDFDARKAAESCIFTYYHTFNFVTHRLSRNFAAISTT